MDRITDSLLKEFSAENDLKSRPESERFEHLSTYITVRRDYAQLFDTSDLVVGSGADTGIDAIAIIVNGTLITDIDQFTELGSRLDYIDAAFVFVQAETSPSFEAAKIGTFSYGVQDFFKPTPTLPRSSAIQEFTEIMAAIYEQSPKFKRGNPVCKLYYVTTGKWVTDPHLEARRKSAIEDLKATKNFGEVEFLCLGADNVQKLYHEAKNSFSRTFVFQNRVDIPETPGITEAYIGYLPISQFKQIITDEHGGIIRSIFYENVRDWHDYNAINTEIKDTLNSEDRSRFVLMNNGVTIIARAITKVNFRYTIEDFQIVNGCQTSHVLHDNLANLDDTVSVPLRLIVTQDENVIGSIIRSTNRQTEVKDEQFFALSEFSKKLERYFSTFPSHSLYYERRAHQYDRMSIEKTRVLTYLNVVRAFASMFLEEPHRITRDFKSVLDKVGRDMFLPGHKLEPYYVAGYTLFILEFMWRNSRLDSKYKLARYQMLLACRVLMNHDNLPQMNSRDMERYCAKAMKVLWNAAAAEKLCQVAASVVEKIASGNLNKDNVRSLPFTEAVIEQCRATPEVEI